MKNYCEKMFLFCQELYLDNNINKEYNKEKSSKKMRKNCAHRLRKNVEVGLGTKPMPKMISNISISATTID